MEIDTNTRNNNIKILTPIIGSAKAIDVETSLYDFTIEFAEINETPPYLLQSIYDTKAEEILSQFKVDAPNFLVDSIKANKINSKKLAFLKPEEINPDKYEKIIKKREMEEYKKNNTSSSDAFKCTKCKKSKCKITQKQTRAGDEPPTTFVTCMECDHTFKF